jgi:hypothetical protein
MACKRLTTTVPPESRSRGAPSPTRLLFKRESSYSLEPGPSRASTCSTSLSSTASSIDASRTKPAYRRSSSLSERDSRSTPGGVSLGRTVCRQRNRTSASRADLTARSRKPRSISASEGGSRWLRVARRPEPRVPNPPGGGHPRAAWSPAACGLRGRQCPAGALATLVVRSEGWAAQGPGAAELVDCVVPRQLG